MRSSRAFALLAMMVIALSTKIINPLLADHLSLASRVRHTVAFDLLETAVLLHPANRLPLRSSSKSVVAEDSSDRVCALGVQCPIREVKRRNRTRERHLDDPKDKKAAM